MVIYGPTTKTVEKLAQLVECEAYHSRTIDRNGVLARFQADTTGVVVATSALGMGVDIPNIRSIIHIGLPRSLLDYAQESGRAGRDGHRSEAITIQPAGLLRPKWDPIHEDPVKAQAEQGRLDRYISPNCCRRVILDEYLDGHQRQYCGEFDDTEQRCDRCDEHWQANEGELGSELGSEPGSEPGSERNGPVPSTTFQTSDPTVLPHVLNQPADGTVHSPMEGIQYSQGPREVIQLTTDSEANSQRSESESVGFRSQVGSISPIYRRSIEPPGNRPLLAPIANLLLALIANLLLAPIANSLPANSLPAPSADSTPQQLTHSLPTRVARPSIPTHAIDQFQRLDRERQVVREVAQAGHQEIATGVEFLQQQAQLWIGRCWFCTQRGLEDQHDLYECRAQTQYGNDSPKRWWLRVRRQIKYAAFGGCYWCGMPQSICSRFLTGSQGHCTYRGLLLSGLAVMVYGEGSEVIKEAWARRLDGLGVSIGNESELVRYLGSRHDGETVKLVHEYIWVRRRWIEYGERS